MKKHQIIGVCLVLGVSLHGCATTSDRKLDDKLGQETSIKSRVDLSADANAIINNAQGLSSDERDRLEALKNSTRAQMDQIGQQSLKLRSILVKDLISSHYDMDEVDLIKGRLSDLEDQRLKVIFDAVSKANDIMGRKSADNTPVFGEMFEPHGSHD